MLLDASMMTVEGGILQTTPLNNGLESGEFQYNFDLNSQCMDKLAIIEGNYDLTKL